MLQQLLNVDIESKSVIRATGVSFVEFSSIHEIFPPVKSLLGQSCRLQYQATLEETVCWSSDAFRVERSFSDNTKYAASRRWKV
jgi:hypothetical protein